MIPSIKAQIKNLLNLYVRRICREEFENQTLRFNERPVEFDFVFRKLAEIYPRSVLDVGTGTTALPDLIQNCGFLVTATDNVRDYWPAGMFNRHYHVVDDDITNTRLRDTFDFITCVSVLEHIENADAAVRNMLTLLNPGGHLLMTLPYNEKRYVRNVYELPGSSYGRSLPYIAQAYSRAQLDEWFRDGRGTIVDQEYWQFWDGDYWTVGNQVIPPRPVRAEDKHQLSCILVQRPS